jgi:hypothetical protein
LLADEGDESIVARSLTIRKASGPGIQFSGRVPARRGCWWHTGAMAPWRVRDFHADDLDAAVRLWDDPAASSEAPAFSLSDLIAAVRSREPAVVAVAGEELVGVAVATAGGDRAWPPRRELKSLDPGSENRCGDPR